MLLDVIFLSSKDSEVKRRRKIRAVTCGISMFETKIGPMGSFEAVLPSAELGRWVMTAN